MGLVAIRYGGDHEALAVPQVRMTRIAALCEAMISPFGWCVARRAGALDPSSMQQPLVAQRTLE